MNNKDCRPAIDFDGTKLEITTTQRPSWKIDPLPSHFNHQRWKIWRRLNFSLKQGGGTRKNIRENKEKYHKAHTHSYEKSHFTESFLFMAQRLLPHGHNL